MSGYLPGQLYTGAEGDLLFVVLGKDGIEFVTNRGTRLTIADIERVYAPLTLTRDPHAPTPVPAQDVIAAVHEALNIPAYASGALDAHRNLLIQRAQHVASTLKDVAERPDLYGGPSNERLMVNTVRRVAEHYPVTYLNREQEQAAEAPALTPPLIICQHCTTLIGSPYGDWEHLDNERRECDPDVWGGDEAEPVDDPAVREFAKGLVGRRVGVPLYSGRYLVGVLTESADWSIKVRVDLADEPEVLRFRQFRHVQPLAEQAGGA